MKTRMLLVITALAVAGFNAVGQGYFLFTANKNSVIDAYTLPGVYVSGGGHTMAGFIWGPAATVGLLGPLGSSPTNSVVAMNAWMDVLSDPNFHLATNSTSGALVTQPVNASGLQIGGIGYLAGSTFTVLGTVGGNTYTLYAIAWNNIYATPQEAAANNSPIGWSNPFQYVSGNGPISTPLGFTSSGMQQFGIGWIPEPSTFALAGLGVTALILLRRWRSKFKNRSRPSDF